ncbi:Cytochrome b6-f complex iron-sulfur subunit [Candidatus Entotheonellaceae bacterium PAL068K]
MRDIDETCACGLPLHARRTVLKGVLGLGLSWGGLAMAQGINPTKARPQKDDRFVFLVGDREGDLITPADLPLGGPPVLAYPMEPQTKVIRNGSRLNQVLLLRLDPAELSESTRSHAVEGIVAYSGFCTHQGCPVSVWLEETVAFKCPCHYSVYDPKNGGRVVAGPARRGLATLPLTIVDDVLVAAGGFVGRVGYTRK